MNRTTFRLVLLISCAHALVHAFELALPSVEQMIGEDFEVSRKQTGMLGTTWRLPFGFGALLAGWLADRYGSKPLLLVFLGGCIATSLLAYWSPSLSVLFVVMFAMGCFASIYHPVGLALISRETTPENLPAALGWHGILGSIGITSAPLIAAIVFGATDIGWRDYYVVLCLPATVIALLIVVTLPKAQRRRETTSSPTVTVATAEPETARWKSFYLLVAVGALSGFVYAAFVHFLTRYLGDSQVLNSSQFRPSGMSAEGFRNLMAAIVLGFAIAGQALAGKIARAGRLEPFLAFIMFANVPCLVWMAFADGPWRLVAACTAAFVHFMNQPVYNSLIAQYVPSARRSVGYGFSNMVCFGIGALGPTCAGFMKNDLYTYGGMAAVITVSGCLALFLNRQQST
ncbi:MAG: MFS transporter [Planctomycetaceae bacterium]|jgi:MFS transporter, FSR family, fosmidomycin resistance protein|nr:MFS transporter [Planctomycetaceae bacterium]MBT6154233.1 MFS transporter [Planctomycetaceae bacterium]MBT6485669.1 MFS transporter [Planctomycetaceae bacterium]MBT6497722.1 MFS transporter [Planctomycetaceae bacterium]